MKGLIRILLVSLMITTLCIGFSNTANAEDPPGGDLGGAIGGLKKNCHIVSPWGSDLLNCQNEKVTDALKSAGKDPAQLNKLNCYTVNVTDTVTIQESDCAAEPFNLTKLKEVKCPNGDTTVGDVNISDDALCLQLAVDKAKEEEAAAKAKLPTDEQRQECTTPDECLRENALINFLKVAINVLSALVGLVVTAMIVLGGIQYASAGGNPNATSAAKKRIFNAIFALIAYLFLFVILEWLLPGGLF